MFWLQIFFPKNPNPLLAYPHWGGEGDSTEGTQNFQKGRQAPPPPLGEGIQATKKKAWEGTGDPWPTPDAPTVTRPRGRCADVACAVRVDCGRVCAQGPAGTVRQAVQRVRRGWVLRRGCGGGWRVGRGEGGPAEVAVLTELEDDIEAVVVPVDEALFVHGNVRVVQHAQHRHLTLRRRPLQRIHTGRAARGRGRDTGTGDPHLHCAPQPQCPRSPVPPEHCVPGALCQGRSVGTPTALQSPPPKFMVTRAGVTLGRWRGGVAEGGMGWECVQHRY